MYDKMTDPADTSPETDWAVIKSIIEAQTQANAGLEQYLLYATHEEFDLNRKEMEACLDEAVRSQERALEDLKAARNRIEDSE